MLSITLDFNIKDIEKDFEVFAAGIKSELISAMTKTLHQVVDRARALTPAEKSFSNITWNLRASIGGVIVSDHAIVETYFPSITQGDQGHSTGITVAQEVATLIEYDRTSLLLSHCLFEWLVPSSCTSILISVNSSDLNCSRSCLVINSTFTFHSPFFDFVADKN